MRTVTDPARGQLQLGKQRNPFAVFFLGVITFGIYWLYWYFKVNAEIRDHEPTVKVSPGIALLAMFVPIANLVSMYNTAVRIERMEQADQVPNTISPLVAFILIWFFGIGYFFQIQGHLNAHWYKHELAAAGRTGLPSTPVVSLPQSAPAPALAEPVAAPVPVIAESTATTDVTPPAQS